MAGPEHSDMLNTALRTAASRAAELAGGGASLLFAFLPGEDRQGSMPRLRAAAGFASLDDARTSAEALASAVREVLLSEDAASLASPGQMGARGQGGLIVMPLCVGGPVHGVLAVGLPKAPTPEVSQTLSQLAWTVGVQLDHARLAAEIDALNAELLNQSSASDEKNDELLKMSETLFAQDIELLRNNEELGRIEKLKSDFIEKMSRELRTPLNSIIEAIIAVLAGENENISESAQAALRGALDEGTAFQRTLQNILDLWQIKQSELEIEIQDVNFSEVIDEAIFSVQDELEGRPVTIEKRIDEPFPKIRTDLTKVNQVLFLMLDNAAKFTNKGTIVIRGEVVDGELVCEIEDTGIGICPDDQPYVFDEFFQVDDRSSTRYRGAGLGLTLVRDLLTLMGGSCDLRSEAGEGTVARFSLPVQYLPQAVDPQLT
jgi:signal transduction histidine kinase